MHSCYERPLVLVLHAWHCLYASGARELGQDSVYVCGTDRYRHRYNSPTAVLLIGKPAADPGILRGCPEPVNSMRSAPPIPFLNFMLLLLLFLRNQGASNSIAATNSNVVLGLHKEISAHERVDDVAIVDHTNHH